MPADRGIGDGVKLVALEELIEKYRRLPPTTNRRHLVKVLRAIAADLQARTPRRVGIAGDELDRKVGCVLAARQDGRDEGPALRSLGEKVVKEWPTIVEALAQHRKGDHRYDHG